MAGLRRVLEPDRPRRTPDRPRRAPAQVLVSSGGGYLLRLGPGGLDAGRLRGGPGPGARPAGGAATCGGAARVVDEALGCGAASRSPGVPGPFAEAERLRLTELRTTAAEERADLLLAQGQAAAAVPELTTLVAAHPLRERARGLLMIACTGAAGRPRRCSAFHDAREQLAEDLGIDPATELTRIHQRVLAMDPALDLSAPQPPSRSLPVEQRDHGWHRCCRALRAGPSGTALAPRPELAPSPAQLPPEPAGFVGRAAELDWLHALLPAAPRAGPAPGLPRRR